MKFTQILKPLREKINARKNVPHSVGSPHFVALMRAELSQAFANAKLHYYVPEIAKLDSLQALDGFLSEYEEYHKEDKKQSDLTYLEGQS